MFPAEAAGNFRFEADVGRGVPSVKHGIVYQRFTESEGEVAELGHFFFCAGVIEGDDFPVTGRQKNNNHEGCQEEQAVTHKGW